MSVCVCAPHSYEVFTQKYKLCTIIVTAQLNLNWSWSLT